MQRINSAPRHFGGVVCTSVALLLCGCTTPEMGKEADRTDLAAAKSCCTSINDLPRPTSFTGQATISLSKESSFFDFGGGLTTFASLSVSGATNRFLTTLAQCRGKFGLLSKGANWDCVEVVLMFRDGSGNVLRHVSSTPTFRVYKDQMFNLTTFHEVPAEAVSVIVYANPIGIGSENSALGRFTNYGAPITVTSTSKFPYIRNVFGEVTLIGGATLAEATKGVTAQ